MLSQKKKNTLIQIIRTGCQLLQEERTLSYANILFKLAFLEKKVSKSTLSNVLTGSKSVGVQSLKKMAEGIQDIVESELGQVYQEECNDFIFNKSADWTPVFVGEGTETQQLSTTSAPQKIYLHDLGRRVAKEKIALYQSAQKEVIEIGVRLSTFANHFTEDNASVFKDPILNMLQSGINFKCYVLNPNGRFAAPYFEDRAKVQPEEAHTLKSLEFVQEKLITIFTALNNQSTKGKMQLYIYNSFPYLHASVVDGDSPNGRMFVSHYLYKISRAEAPGMELRRQWDERLYGKYWESVVAMMEQSSKQLV